MLQSQFGGIRELVEMETGEQRVKSRSYQIRIKQRRSELEDYDLKEIIGQGGFGKVRKATHRLTGETVAVKICSTDQGDPEALATILREIELQRNLLHENIAQIYEVVRKDNTIYIFMEYCRNGELFERINRSGPFPEREAARIFHQLLSALLYLRNSGVSHRDIKPENVLFDEQWNVKLIDFGFSCPANGDFRKTICGTPSYTPPEIIRKVKYDPELVDVWCLGVTLYAMLAAQLPFEGETNDKRKANILACKFEQKPTFTPRAQKLFAWIFVDAKYRPKLSELLTCQFSLNYEPPQPSFIDFKNENPVSEEAVLQILQREHHMEPKKVTDSVANCKFDRHRATYYLTIRTLKNTQKHALMNQFRKQRKNSLIKLQPISRTPTPTKKDGLTEKDSLVLALKTSKLNLDAVFGQRMRVGVDPSSARLRKSSLDSPRRLLDCLAAYKGV